MKNVDLSIKNVLANTKFVLMFVLFLLVLPNVNANIITPTASAMGGYQPGTTSTVMFSVSFDSNTAESADFIEFRMENPIAGVSLWHSLPSPSPYQGCGENKGDEMTATGPGWGRPGFINGDSQCGAFEGGMTHTFGIDVASDGAFTGSFNVEVRFVGDGTGEVGASEAITVVTIQPIVCSIVCPDVAPITAPANSCSMNFNVPPPVLSGDCGNTPPSISDEFPVGDTEVTYTAVDDNGNTISCSTIITVIDDEDPFVSGVQNLTADLAAGECGYVIPQTFTITENCTDPERTITQSEDIGTFESGYHCVGGPSKYLRVFNTDDEGINTELNIEEVTFGVLEAFGNPFVTVNIYSLDGNLDYNNMELLASGVDVLPDFEDALYTIPVSATIPAGEEFVVEIVVPGSQFNGVILAMNQGGETAPTYIASDFCGFSQPVTLASQSFPDYGAIMIVDGYETSYVLRAVGSGVEVGDTAYEGVTTVDYEVEDASGNIATISFTVTVTGFDGAISAIACNDEVQVSLDDDCEAVVTADMILEGGPYGCYDEYTVEISDEDNNSYGNTVTSSNVGQTLTVMITSPGGNSCWGTIIVEDKNPPVLDCMDVYTTCFGETFPGSPIAEMVTFPANIASFNESIDAGAPSNNSYTVPVQGLIGSTTTNIGVRLNIEHEFVSDLSATVTAPDGTTATLFVNPGTTCAEDNLMITLDGSAFNTYADLEAACNPMSPAISGTYMPMQSLAVFNMKDPNGDWIITVSDTKAGDGGTVIAAELIVSQSGGVVAFPTENDILTQTEGDNVFTVIGLDACGPATLGYNDFIIEQDCSSPYSEVIQRTWSGEDANGNTSESCIQTIYVFRNGLSTLTFPPNYDGIQEDALSCAQFGDMVPPTSVTGGPDGDLCDNVQIVPFVDTRIEICENSYKLVRHFEVLEWCTGEIIEHNQIIKVIDDQGPVLGDIEDITISAGDFDCTADHVLTNPEIVSDCSDEFEYKAYYLSAYNAGPPPEDEVYYEENVTYTNGGAIILRDLIFGDTWVKWVITDECGNSTTDYFTITVEDQVNPIAVCDEFTVVSVGSDGFVDVFATTFDDGSLDNCGIDRMRARKMTNACSGVGTSFSDKVTFCCEEVGEVIMVAFEVTDLSGNQNTCMVEVTVQDKLPPYITECPDDITLNCQSEYEDLEITGEPEFIDNCEVVSINYDDSGNIDNCGEGVILRTWTVTDKQGFKASCVQRITLEDNDPFVENDIDWPNDYTATTCDSGLDPDDLPVNNAYPRYDDDNCSLVAATHKDTKFSFVDGACEKILREWTVIDWCTYDENNPIDGEGIYHHLQVIKLVNSEGPEITNCDATVFDVFGNCAGDVSYTLEATDDCTPSEEIAFTYQIDINDDGITGLDFNLNDDSNSFDESLPVGTHRVYWTAEDKCGNATYCDMLVIVEDGKKPTPYCQSSITTVVMNNNGMVDIWARDFDLGSTDNCTPYNKLKFAFSSNVADSSRIFTCDDIPNGIEQEIQIEMWVTDEAGNKEYCSIALILQDSNEDVCPDEDGFTGSVNGSMLTSSNGYLEEAVVTVYSPALEVSRSVMSDESGAYGINNLPYGPGYLVRAEKNDDVRNGVSTIDLVHIQRHILGLAEFDDPYKVIASDINNDERIKASDLVALRKVILGVINEFPNGQKSWRFMQESETFADNNDPFGYNENLNIGTLDGTLYNQDMMAVKIGDVNGSAESNLTSNTNASSRSRESVAFFIDDMKVEAGDRVEVPVYASDLDEMMGYQFTLDIGSADFIAAESGQVELSDENFAYHKSQITTLWGDGNVVALDNDEPLFTLILDVNDDANLSQLLTMNSSITSAEVYDVDGEVNNLELVARSLDTEEGFVLYQNKPNPFTESTTLSFFLPESEEVVLTITDVTGRLVMKSKKMYSAGTQTVQIDYTDLNVSGIMYYTITAGQYTATKKMINVR